VNILDENIDSVARDQLRSFKVRFRHIGTDIGRSGMKDLNDVIPLLHSLRRPTFFTRDGDFYSRTLAHARYCLVHLDVRASESAEYVVRFLRLMEFQRQRDRMGKIIRLRPNRLSYREVNSGKERRLDW
jgi:hypothetical protein